MKNVVKIIDHKSKRSLITAGDPDELCPVPSRSEFDKQECDYIEAKELRAVGEAIIEKMGGFSYLVGLEIVYFWKKSGGKRSGVAVLGNCQRPSGLLAKFPKLPSSFA